MVKQEIPLKKSNVSYSNNKITKSLTVPLLNVKYKFGTKMADPVWKKAAWAKDFAPYRKDRVDKKSEMALFRTEKHLILGFFFYENPENLVRPADQSCSIWSGDMAEIHFGDMEPDPWLFQTGVGISGIRFDSTGNYDKWQAKTFETEKGWGAEVRFDLSLLRLSEGGFRFNLCRQASKRGELSSWSPLQLRFHEVENYGELLFTDYKTALQLKSGKVISGKVSRKDYELARSKDMIPAQKVLHGPYLSAPDANAVQISWETAGLVPSYLEYKVKGSKAAPKQAFSSKNHGILNHNTSHSVYLTDLEPGKEYEYEIFTLRPVTMEPDSSGIRHTFAVPEKNAKKFNFYCITDIHSDVGYIRRALALPEAGKSDFIALLGDNLSHAAGSEALYKGIIDPILEATTVERKDKPMVFVRGNHEQLGVYAKEYFNVMRHPSGKTYYAFTYDSVFFLVLDSGSDSNRDDEGIMFSNRAAREQQKEFIAEVVKSEAYQKADFRVVLMHIPPLQTEKDLIYGLVYGLTEPLRNAKIKPDVMLCGHIHAYEKVNAGENHYAPETRSGHAEKFPETFVNPYPVIAHVNTAGLFCEVTAKEMTLSVLQTLDGKPVELLDRIKLKKQKR
ncbi:MAG: metallophosphoesterase [Lentisphaeria bacterium]|nr:metallophosphoesterase [Lentisphaeria bacterium]